MLILDATRELAQRPRRLRGAAGHVDRLGAAVRRRAILLVGAALLLSAAACRDDDGDIVDPPPPPPAAAGRVTFWRSDPSPSPIQVMLSGQVLGLLTAHRTSAPGCGGPSSTDAITVERPAGTYSMYAYETMANGYWGPRDITIQEGGCLLFELRP